MDDMGIGGDPESWDRLFFNGDRKECAEEGNTCGGISKEVACDMRDHNRSLECGHNGSDFDISLC